ncbi:hypothetical protein PLIIFM63780_006178 [Purpureocillium lilacinum]|nr:hypothetical protein PLIIFM63780_006178 [Purpureocillium lilacinum]
MSAAKMAFVNSIMVLVAVFAAGVFGAAQAPYSNGQVTETAPPQELGSTTSAGSLVYSLNMCTIVHSTNCQVSLSTGGAAPPAAKSSAAAPAPAPGSGSSAAGDGSGGPPPTASDKPAAPTVITSTNAGGSPVVVTQTPGAESSALAGGRTLSSGAGASGSATESSTGAEATQSPGGASGTASGSGVPPTPTGGANNAVGLVKGIAYGAAAMAMAFVV